MLGEMKHNHLLTTALALIFAQAPSFVVAQPIVDAEGTVDGIMDGATASSATNVRVGADNSNVAGTGSVDVTGGATVNTDVGAEIGNTAGSVGSVTISGAGSVWVSGTDTGIGHVAVGRYGGTGSITVSESGRFETVIGGIYAGAGSTLTFTGVGTTVDIGSFTDEVKGYPSTNDPVPQPGEAAGWLTSGGKMFILDGAYVRSDGGYLGGEGLGLSEAVVDGAGTIWENELPLYVGGNGNGVYNRAKLTISNGAYVIGHTIAAGVDVGCAVYDGTEETCATEMNSEGEIIITGEGSVLEAKEILDTRFKGNIRVGYDGTGSMTVSDGGTARNSNARADAVFEIASNAGSIGVLTIGGKLADGPAAAGFIDSKNGLTFGMGQAKLVFNHTETDYVFSQDLAQMVEDPNDPTTTGDSEIIQAAGTTIYTGDGTEYNGKVSVRGGVLRVNDVLNGTFTVKTSGELGGKGSVGEVTVENGGTLRPGDTEGATTLSATSLQLNSGSKTVIDWSPTAQNASLLVEDAATITSGAILDVTFAPGTLVKLTDKHHVMSLSNTAAGNVDGNFTLGTNSQNISRFLGLSLENDVASPDDVYLTVAQTSGFDSVGGLNRRQTAVAKAVAGLADGSDLQTLLLNAQSDEEARNAFSALYGDVHEHQIAANLRGMSLAANSVMSRTGATLGSNDASINSNKAVWGTAIHSRDTSSLNDADATEGSVTTGLVAGADLFAFGDWTLGAYASFQNGETSGNEQSGSQDTKIVGLYSGMRGGAVNAAFGLGAGLSSDKTTRRIALSDDVAEGAHQGTYVQAFGEVSKTFKIGQNSFVEPFARMSLTQGQTEAFNETGSLAALSVGGGDFSERAGQIGVRSEVSVSGADSTARYFGSLALENVARSGSFTKTFAQGGSMESVGLDGTSSQVAFQLGTSYDLNGAGNLSISYEGKIGEATSDGALSLSLVKQF
jgi:T5SS/PEP-CTERM-associated repeat protein